MDDERMRVCLERTVELWPTELRLREWPGLEAPLVHVPDPVSPSDDVLQALADTLAPRHRLLSLVPRTGQAYQVAATDLLSVVDQFGFSEPVLIGERLGCVVALLVAAWWPERVGKLVLVEPSFPGPPNATPLAEELDTLEARSLRHCPPDWASLREAVQCPLLVVRWGPSAIDSVEAFVSG